jgi:DNA-binding SARP family transcriptional activator
MPDHVPITIGDAMIELRILGPARLTGPEDAAVEAVLVQPKRLALLAFLVLSPDPMVSRERLLALLWPESDERRAREALRQALRFLRRTLGSEVLVSQGRNWVGIDRGRLDCDAWRFEALLSAGDAAGALALYGGDALEGLEVRGVAGFDQWLAELRRDLARKASGAAWSLAEAARDAGDQDRALAMAWRAREIVPGDEEGLRRLMGLLLWAGDRAGALQAYEAFETWLAAEFEAVPSVRTRELATRARGPVAAEPVHGFGSEGAPEAFEVAPALSRPAVAAMPVARRAPAPASRTRWRRAPLSLLPGRVTPSRRTVVAALALAVGLAVVAFTSSWLVAAATGRGLAATDNTEVLVVMPFKVARADASLGFLEHGMADLIGAVFTGELGPRAVPEPLRPVRRWGLTGAGRSTPGPDARWTLRGEVMGNERDVRLSGTLTDGRNRRATVSTAVSGPADSVYALARELAIRLLAMHMGVREDEAIRLGKSTPAAVHSHLLGRMALNQGRFEEADRRFHEALRYDSLFAPAAVGLVETHLVAPWLRGHVSELALPLAYRLVDRLGPADREFVLAAAGPRYPERSTHLEYYQAWERAVTTAPDRAPVWYQWGDALFHVGPFIGIPDHMERATAAFEHALTLDPEYLVPLDHLIEVATAAGDARRARQLLDQLLAGTGRVEPVNVDYLRWRVALVSEDSATLQWLRDRHAVMPSGSLGAMVRAASLLGNGLDDADRIVALDFNRWRAPAERWNLLVRFNTHALNRGWPSEARRLADAVRDVAPTPSSHLHMHIRGALGAGGDVAAAREAAAQLEAHVELGPVSEQSRRPGLVADVCALETWKLFQGDPSTARRAIRWLRDPTHQTEDEGGRQRCAVFLEALLIQHEQPRRLAEAVARIQVLADQGVQLPGAGYEPVWLFLAQAQEDLGNYECALDVIRRRGSNPFMLPTQLRIEGRLAALVGDTAAARRAYAHYLALRSDPEPALRAERAEVLARYRALLGPGDG